MRVRNRGDGDGRCRAAVRHCSTPRQQGATGEDEKDHGDQDESDGRYRREEKAILDAEVPHGGEDGREEKNEMGREIDGCGVDEHRSIESVPVQMGRRRHAIEPVTGRFVASDTDLAMDDGLISDVTGAQRFGVLQLSALIDESDQFVTGQFIGEVQSE